MEELPDPEYRSILTVDVEKFSAAHRNDRVQSGIRAALYRVLRESFSAASVPWDECTHEDRGDGAIILVPPTVPKVLLLAPLLDWLSNGLATHNRTASLAERFRLRFALHCGEVLADRNGYAGDAVVHVCRLLDAPQLREALKHADTDLAVIVSDLVYNDIVRPGYRHINPAAYHPVEISVKDTHTHAWIHLPHSTQVPTTDSSPDTEPASTEQSAGVHIEGTATGKRSVGVKIGKIELR